MRLATIFAVLMMFSASVFAATESFETWLLNFKTEALQSGISQKTLEEALAGVQPLPRVIELDRKQPEGSITFAEYQNRVINDARISQGRHLLSQHHELLEKVSKEYGVQPQYIVALWGLETSYGNNTGGFKVVDALATLAYDGRRSSFFRKELLNALKILNEGHIEAGNMKGSWAGAMGQNQFMPSSFHAFAEDHNHDGKRDIWESLPDVFASTANYLSRSGWKSDERWGRRVSLPVGISENALGLDNKKRLSEWKNSGVTLLGGADIPVVEGMYASIVVPDGINGPAFLVYDNYRVIMRWNKSTYFATTVGMLADAIAP